MGNIENTQPRLLGIVIKIKYLTKQQICHVDEFDDVVICTDIRLHGASMSVINV